jgi:hypothetical protein
MIGIMGPDERSVSRSVKPRYDSTDVNNDCNVISDLGSHALTFGMTRMTWRRNRSSSALECVQAAC